jgi:hypothetical protein
LQLGEAALAFPKVPDHLGSPGAGKQAHALTEWTVGPRMPVSS